MTPAHCDTFSGTFGINFELQSANGILVLLMSLSIQDLNGQPPSHAVLAARSGRTLALIVLRVVVISGAVHFG
jgi:hypothetical protein